MAAGTQSESCWSSSLAERWLVWGQLLGTVSAGDSVFEVCCPRRTVLITGLWSRSQFPWVQPCQQRAGRFVPSQGQCLNEVHFPQELRLKGEWWPGFSRALIIRFLHRVSSGSRDGAEHPRPEQVTVLAGLTAEQRVHGASWL